MRYISTIALILSIGLMLSASAFCQDISLSWDPSPTENVSGYKVYYKAGDMSQPFDGTGADQGPSPVDVGDTLSVTLTGLSDGTNYYFTVTAYDNNSNQSNYSNIVSNSWIPSLMAPSNGAVNEPVPVTFRWETAPSGYSVEYTLYYGTSREDVSNAAILPPPNSGGHNHSRKPVLLLFLLGAIVTSALLLMRSRAWHYRMTATITVLFFGSLLASCGGGGGGESSSKTPTTPTPTEELFSVAKGNSDYHQAFDLKAGTTYYWKVVATDTNDNNLKYESQVQSLTTEVF